MLKRSETWLTLVALLALACGGNAIDLGHDEHAGWSDVDEAAHTTEPHTIFASDAWVFGLALDGPTLYALIDRKQTFELVACPLLRCGSQRTTLFSRPKQSGEGHWGTPLVAAASTLYWAHADGHRSQILSCPTTGCAEPRVLTTSWKCGLAADDEGAYWVDLQGRMMRQAPDSETSTLLRDLSDEKLEVSKLVAHGAYIYLVGSTNDGSSVRRLRKDGTNASEALVADQHISAFSVARDTVYYLSQTLVGRVGSCSLEGCATGASTLASNQRWPSAIRVENDEAFWFNNPQGVGGLLGATLVGCLLPNCATVTTRRAEIPIGEEDEHFAVSPQEIVWLELSPDGRGTSLRRLAR